MFDNNLRRGSAGAAGAYEIDRSLRFNGADNAYLSFTPGSAGNQTTWTYSVWVKRSALSSADYDIFGNNANFNDYLFFNATTDNFEYYVSNAGGYSGPHNTNAIYRDTAAWYHIVWTRDTNNGTDADRSRIYVNGVRQTMSAQPSISSGFQGHINAASEHRIGNLQDSFDYEGYMTEINFIDGQALDASSFGETDSDTGAWVPKKYAGSYGSQGYYLNFSDNSNTTAATLGKDSSGNSNNWTPNNFSVSAGVGDDSSLDTPTNNCCTMSSTDHGGITVSNGGLDMGGNTQDKHVRASWALPESGKYYWEVTATTVTSPHYHGVGIAHISASMTSAAFATDGFKMYAATGEKYHDADSGTGFDTFDDGDVISIAVDMDAGKIWAAKNGTWQASGNPATGANPMYDNFLAYSTIKQWHPSWHSFKNGNVASFNFGQRAFAHTPPTGFKTLCTANLPEPTIKDGTKYFNTVLWSGNNTSGRGITGVGFQPDFVWIKSRSHDAAHQLFDDVRGANKVLQIDDSSVEVTNPAYGYLSAFNSDGFTLTEGTYTDYEMGNVNMTGRTYVGWNWKEGASNGFDIVSFTPSSGANTYSHGLGVKPDCIFFRSRTEAAAWDVYHSALTADYKLYLSDSVAKIDSGFMNDTEPTSSVFTYDPGSQDGETHIAYCFSNVSGFLKAGSYLGNGTANGPFVYTGFKVAYLLVKNSNRGAHWTVYDIKRETINPNDEILEPNNTNTEVTGHDFDFLSNGFQVRNSNSSFNHSGETMIFMAIAETPFKYANAR